MWFRSGDLLIMDEFGWMYFVDRMGDTFRWRGENVSTIEVEAVLSTVLQQQDTIVYGVEVPGVEGRCGMACIVAPSGGLDLASFLAAVKKQLPSYATPIFLRLVQHLDLTGTFKLKKIVMQQEGYNPNVSVNCLGIILKLSTRFCLFRPAKYTSLALAYVFEGIPLLI